MARQSFRGAGGAGAVVVPYSPVARPYEHRSGAYEVGAILRTEHNEGDRRIAGALAIVASGVLVAVAIFVAGWTLSG